MGSSSSRRTTAATTLIATTTATTANIGNTTKGTFFKAARATHVAQALQLQQPQQQQQQQACILHTLHDTLWCFDRQQHQQHSANTKRHSNFCSSSSSRSTTNSISALIELVVTLMNATYIYKVYTLHSGSISNNNNNNNNNNNSNSNDSNNNDKLSTSSMDNMNFSTFSDNDTGHSMMTSSRSIGSNTGSNAIITVATTMASASVSMAMAGIPANLVIAATNSTPANQSATDKVELIEMNLANETLSTYPALRHYHSDFDVSYIAKINPFWLQFEPPNARTYYIMAIIYIIISSVGCLGNALVIFMFIRCKSLRTPANTLVINLAVSDLIMLVKCPIAIYNNFKQGPALGDIGCRIYGFVGGLSGTASIGTLTAIALDRYNVVVYPLDPLRKTAKFRPAIAITLIWIYSFMFSVVPALDIGLSVYVPEGFLTTCSFDYLDKRTGPRVFMFLFFVAAWCLPFATICYSYFYILKVVMAANRIQSNKNKNKTEQKLAMIVIGIIGLWFLAWTPYSVVAMLGVFGQEQYLTPLGSMIPALFCKTAACIDPYIYAATHPRFRMEFRRFLGGSGHFRRSSTTRSSYLTRSSTRRLRVISDVDVRNRSADNSKNKNLTVVPELTEENDDLDITVEELRDVSNTMEQSRF